MGRAVRHGGVPQRAADDLRGGRPLPGRPESGKRPAENRLSPGAAAGGALPLPERKAVSSAPCVGEPYSEIREGDRRRFRRQ